MRILKKDLLEKDIINGYLLINNLKYPIYKVFNQSLTQNDLNKNTKKRVESCTLNHKNNILISYFGTYKKEKYYCGYYIINKNKIYNILYFYYLKFKFKIKKLINEY